MNLPDWAPLTTISVLSKTTGTGATGTGTVNYTPSGTTFQGHWQPVSAVDAVKAGRQGSKETREIWTQDPAADAVGLSSALELDGKKWSVISLERWQGDPVAYFLVEVMV